VRLSIPALYHTLKNFESAVKSTSQNGLRGGSATTYMFPSGILKLKTFIVLKNNAGTDDNRVRKLDY
jgi:ribonucleoside-diphosphate reductase alpha chain